MESYMKKDPRITLSLIWIVVMVNMIFNDIFSILVELVKGNTIDIPLEITTMMLVAGVITNIPIFMILLSYVLKHRINRIVNISAASFTIIYIIGGGSLLPHYILIGAIEVILCIAIIVISKKWKVAET